MNDIKALYQETIIDHSKYPRNFGTLDEFTHSATGYNPLCGDSLKIFVCIEDARIVEISFIGDGCAISKSSASLMTEVCKGKTLAEFAALFSNFRHLVTTQDAVEPDMPSKLRVFMGVRDYPARVKCATLAWHALDAAVHNRATAQTE